MVLLPCFLVTAGFEEQEILSSSCYPYPLLASSFIVKLYLILLSSVLLAPVLHGQVKTMSMQFVCIPRAAGEEDTVEVVVGRKKTLEVKIPSNELSQEYRVPRSNPILVGKKVDRNGNVGFDTYASFAPPAGRNVIVILGRKGATNADGFTAKAINADSKNFRAGQYLLYNICSETIECEIGGDVFSLQPDEITLKSPKGDVKEDLAHVKLFVKSDDGEAKPFFTNNWPIRGNARSIVVIYKSPATDKYMIRAINDYL